MKNGTSASIETLSGFKEAYAGMTNFLHDQSEEKRAAVMQSLESQLKRMENVLALAETEQESATIIRSRELAEALRTDVDALWTLHGEETEIRAAISDTMTEIDEGRGRVNATIDTVSEELEAALTVSTASGPLGVALAFIITEYISSRGSPSDSAELGLCTAIIWPSGSVASTICAASSLLTPGLALSTDIISMISV